MNFGKIRKDQKSGSTGVSPVQSFKITKRKLPHWQEPGRVYFITWRCREGQTLSHEERDITLEALKHWDGRKWVVYAAVVLPDHIHCLAQPKAHPAGGAVDLGEILHSIKSFTSHKINRLRGATGAIWQIERYDRIVRDEAEFLEKWNYIRNNPIKGGFAEFPEDYPWLYEKG